MSDEKGPDEKILAVAIRDPRYGYRKTLEELNNHTVKEIQHFFEVYKQLEEKSVEIDGWYGRDLALELIAQYRVA